MSTNAQLAAIFREMAAILELTGADAFRVNAHARVSRALKDLAVDVATIAEDEAKLVAIEGIGKASAKKIGEFVRTGAVAEHQELRGSIPIGLLEVMGIQGLGPKTVRMLWQKANVTDLASLKAALDAGGLESLPRMGAKTIANIRESIAFAEKAAKRVRLGTALPVAEAIADRLRAVPGVTAVEHAGSLRRGCETIGDIDIVAATDDPDALSESFRSMPGVEKVLLAGTTKVALRLEAGIQVDLRMIPEASYGAALMYFTGSKEHNVALRERAQKRSMRLNEYGLFPEDGGDQGPPQERGVAAVAARTEREIYAALDLPWIPPELREDRGELNTEPPNLIELDDIKAELHAHTTASDGHQSIEQLARAARDRGFHTVAVTDHSRSSAQANGLSIERLMEHIAAIREIDEKTSGIAILAGAEVDILADGRLDYPDEVLEHLDIVVASPHVALKQDAARATRRLVAAIEHPLVHILGHPTGRVIGRRPGLSPDMPTLIAAAIEHDTALEINANFLRLDLRDIHVRAAVEAGALISINTDAHEPAHLDYLRYGILTARRGWLPPARCVNTWTAGKLRHWREGTRTMHE